MPIKFVVGDATQPIGEGAKIITHVCNDVGGWGRGFVVAISKRWKEPEQAYRQWYETGENFRLGAVQFVEVDAGLEVANLIGQHGLRSTNEGPPVRYSAIREGLAAINARALEFRASVHMPRIGCGLAGGKWEEIEQIAEQMLENTQVFVYDLPSLSK